MNFKLILTSVAIASLLSGCDKDDKKPETEDTTGNVTLKFNNYAGDAPLSLNPSAYNYKNANGDSFKVTDYKYYISDIRFVKSDGSEYHDQDSHFLIDASLPASMNRVMEKIPNGSYTSMKVLMGVDSTHNVSGAQSGDLDPLYGMFWTWNTGYIMSKIEGRFKKAGGEDAFMSFHLGGFKGSFSVLREVTLPFPQELKVNGTAAATVTLKSDILKWFEAPYLIKFTDLNMVGSAGNDAAMIAENHKSSLKVVSVQQ